MKIIETTANNFEIRDDNEVVGNFYMGYNCDDDVYEIDGLFNQEPFQLDIASEDYKRFFTKIYGEEDFTYAWNANYVVEQIKEVLDNEKI